MNETKRVGAMQALVCYGRSALQVTMPVFAALNCEPCPMPTAVLSSHPGGYKHYRIQDMTAQLVAQIDAWRAEAISMDAVVTGYMYSEEQIEIARRFINEQRRSHRALALVDPVMGDHGRLYAIVTPAMRAAMRSLASEADIITPNFSEACWLLDAPYTDVPLPPADVQAMAERLCALGPGQVVITGAHLTDGFANVVCARGEPAYCVYFDELPAQFPGTGDIFAAVLLGSILGSGIDMRAAVTRAAAFVHDAVAVTAAAGTPSREGVLLESLLRRLS